jgi:hypothetical protein
MAQDTSCTGDQLSGLDPNVICDSLAKCSDDDNVTLIGDYLTAYRELNKFFYLLGKVFSFVASDVDSKIAILEAYRSDPETGDNYMSIQSMLKYEEANNLLKDSKRPSGARTLLRLHRALDFFSLFMQELSAHDDSSATIAKDCYKKTLAKHHPWYMQKTVSLAMYALPSRAQIIESAFNVGKGDESADDLSKSAADKMLHLANSSKRVFEIVEKLYSEKQLLELP